MISQRKINRNKLSSECCPLSYSQAIKDGKLNEYLNTDYDLMRYDRERIIKEKEIAKRKKYNI